MIFLWFSILVLFYVLSGISPVYLNPFLDGPSKKLNIIAHRGASGTKPENTIASFQEAMQSKASKIELDIQLTRDGQIVVVHDAFVKDTRDKKYFIAESTLSELRAVQPDMPLLSEVLQLVNGNKELLIEIKKYDGYSESIEEKTLQAIKESNGIQWCILQCFHNDILIRLKSLEKNVRLAKLLICVLPYTELVVDGQWTFQSASSYEYVEEFNAYHVLSTRNLLNIGAKYDKRVNVWTINNKKVISRFAKLGVDGFITDYP